MDLAISKQVEYNARSFKRIICKNKTIESKRFYDCKFINCSFNEAVFRNCIFVDCAFEDCDLSLARVPGSTFNRTEFKRSKVIGVNWTEANWPQAGLLNKRSIDFFDCVLNYSVFMGLNLEGMTISKCIAKEASFEESNLTKANCTSTDFSSSRFVRTDLTEADFTNAINYSIDVNLNIVHKARFSLPEAMSLLYSLDIVLVESNPE